MQRTIGVLAEFRLVMDHLDVHAGPGNCDGGGP